MIHQVLDRIYKIELPIPFPLMTMNVYRIEEYGRIRSMIHSLGILKSIMLRNGAPRGLVKRLPLRFRWIYFPGSSLEVFLGISEAVGHLEILKEKGMVRLKGKEEKDYYSLET